MAWNIFAIWERQTLARLWYLHKRKQNVRRETGESWKRSLLSDCAFLWNLKKKNPPETINIVGLISGYLSLIIYYKNFLKILLWFLKRLKVKTGEKYPVSKHSWGAGAMEHQTNKENKHPCTLCKKSFRCKFSVGDLLQGMDRHLPNSLYSVTHKITWNSKNKINIVWLL